jgi:hypothetical protein
MSSSDTVAAITENLREVLVGLGINFSFKSFDDRKDAPASASPVGIIIYKGESFDEAHGQRPGYIEAVFDVNVLIYLKVHEEALRVQQEWIHRIRQTLTVNALNVNALLLNKKVSRVEIPKAEALSEMNKSSINLLVKVRYRD